MIDRTIYQKLPLRNTRVTICGSTRFRDAFQYWNTNLTLAGNIVYSVALWTHAENESERPTKEEKILLDRVHLSKIENSDAIFVLDVGGYIGESTTKEIEFAKSKGKEVYYLTSVAPEYALAR